MKKMLVLDLDGTSITDSQHLSGQLKRIVRNIKKEHLVYIATGRSISDAYKYYKSFDLHTDLICHNGGLVYNPDNREVKYKLNICNAKGILNYLFENKRQYQINNIVLSCCNETYLLTDKNKYLCKTIINKDLPHFSMDFSTLPIHDVQRILVSTSNGDIQHLINQLNKSFNQVTICSWKGCHNIVDISVSSGNKWFAVQKIAKESNVLRENIVSFGNDSNDIELLRNSGIGICMINGAEEVKSVSDYITLFDNNNDGVYDFLQTQLSKIFNIA